MSRAKSLGRQLHMRNKNPMKNLVSREKMRKSLTGRKLSKEHSEKLKFVQELAFQNILKEIPELEKQGFRCIPIGRVIPDIIAIKDGKVWAVEVERGKPNYNKYKKGDYRKYFEGVIWILREKR